MELDPFSIYSNSEPLVMVHKGWAEADGKGDLNPSPRTTQASAGKLPLRSQIREIRDRAPAPQKFEFVNGTDPFVNKEPDVRKLVRAHVVRDSSRKKKQLKEASRRSGRKILQSLEDAKGPEENEDSASIDEAVAVGFEHALILTHRLTVVSPSLDPNPEISPVIYHIKAMGTAMWPLEDSVRFNPISPAGWFDWALMDEALLHSLLYTTSTYAGLLSGTTESKEAIVHEGKSMSLVNKRLSSLSAKIDGEEIDEGTIGAVSCLAITEVLRGNLIGFQVHMKGVKQMVELKGGILTLSLKLQLKLHRVDLMSSLDFFGSSTPFFAEINQLPKYSSTTLSRPTTNKPLLQFLNTLPIDAKLVNTLITLSNFSHQISEILSSRTKAKIPRQIALLKETYGLRYSFLQPSTLHSENTPQSLSDQKLNEFLRIGALLYIQATLQEFPLSAIGSRNIVARLRESVMIVRIRNQKEGELMVWLLFMGGMESRDGEDREWFVEQIGRLVGRLGMGWEEVTGALEGLWWVERIHGERGRVLWDEVELQRVMKELS